MKKSFPLFLLPLMLLISACSEQTPPPDAEQAQADAPGAQSQLSESDLAIGTPIDAITSPLRETAAEGGVQEIEWDSLIPEDYQPDKILARYDLDNLTDDDPRAAQLQAELQELWDKAPVRPELDGRSVKLPGFVVPVETDAEETTGFLLVPYYGACIHVPPPPANQTVYVVAKPGEGTKPAVFDIVWVTGDMSVTRIDNDVAEAGYTIYASKIEPYE